MCGERSFWRAQFVIVSVAAGLVTPPLVAVISTVPGASAVTTPLLLMEASRALLLPQLNVTPEMELPLESRAVAVKACVAPTRIVADVGASVIVLEQQDRSGGCTGSFRRDGVDHELSLQRRQCHCRIGRVDEEAGTAAEHRMVLVFTLHGVTLIPAFSGAVKIAAEIPAAGPLA